MRSPNVSGFFDLVDCACIGAKRGNNQPTIEEVELAQKNIFNPSMYGSTLQEVMEVSLGKYSEMDLWVTHYAKKRGTVRKENQLHSVPFCNPTADRQATVVTALQTLFG